MLQFRAELAVAHEAVAAQVPDGWFEDHGLLPLATRVADHREFLLRPDLGRRLDDASRARLRGARRRRGPDVQIILADGLSAVACTGSGLELLAALTPGVRGPGPGPSARRSAPASPGSGSRTRSARSVGARAAAILLGERPGLGTGDGLSAYLVHEPRVGKTDGDRNMMSNIHGRGTPPAAAATRLAALIGAMLEQRTSGVGLDLSGLDAGGTGYRAPQVRERLVEVP